jgi:hypothetical protein
MARQRLLKPAVFQHQELHHAEMVSALPLRVAYMGLWCQCDRRGCFEWKPSKLKLNVLPFDNVDFGAVLSALEAHDFIRSYVVDGRRFGYVPTFERHQHFHRDEKLDRLIPDPPSSIKHGASTVPAPCEPDASTPNSGSSLSNRLSTSASTSASAPPSAAATTNTEAGMALTLTRAANAAIEARCGPQVNPLIASNGPASELATALLEAGIGLDVAEPSIVRQVNKHATGKIRSMNYFLGGILEDATIAKERGPAGTPGKPFNRGRRGASAWDDVA